MLLDILYPRKERTSSSLRVVFARLCFGDEEEVVAESFSKHQNSGRPVMIRSTDTKNKHRKEFRATRLENCRRKPVKREPRILCPHCENNEPKCSRRKCLPVLQRYQSSGNQWCLSENEENNCKKRWSLFIKFILTKSQGINIYGDSYTSQKQISKMPYSKQDINFS